MIKDNSTVLYEKIVCQLMIARRKKLNVNQAIHISSALLTRTLQKRLADLHIPLDRPPYISWAGAWYKVFTMQKRDRIMLEIIQEEITRVREMSNENLFNCFGGVIDGKLRGVNHE